jgi:hypothetical protein
MDRCYVHGNSGANITRVGIGPHCSYFALIDSYLEDFKDTGDANAIECYNGDGPFKIVNNFLEGAGENIMFGGENASITDLTPSDIEIRGNHFYKRSSWRESGWAIKNLLELKHAQRVEITGNVFENNWLAGQAGQALVFTPRAYTGMDWARVWDVTVTENIVRDAASGVQILVSNDVNQATEDMERVLIRNNLFYNIDGPEFENENGGYLFNINSSFGLGGPGVDFTIDHNTMLQDQLANKMVDMSGEQDVIVDRVAFKNNLFTHADYGFLGDSRSTGTDSMDIYLAHYQYRKNAAVDRLVDRSYGYDWPSVYPADNWFPDKIAGVDFDDYSAGMNGDITGFRLAGTSPYKNAGTDGEDIGADIDAVMAATAGAITGLRGLTKTATVGVSDNVTITVKHRRSVADTVGISDNTFTGELPETVVDTVGISDLVTATIKHRRASTGTAGISDNVLWRFVRKAAPTATAGISDNVIATVKHRRLVADTVGVSDAIATPTGGGMAPYYYLILT